MSKIIIYHNPRWGKSRDSVGILEKRRVEYTIVKYLESPLSIEQLKKISIKLNLRPKHFIRKTEEQFKSLNLAKDMENDERLFIAMAKHPKIIERPIIINGNKACIGRPPEKILEII